MAQIRCDFWSEALQVSTSMTVLIPQSAEGQIGAANDVPAGDLPVLYLLHGLSDDHTAWTRYTSIERYLLDRPVAVVMPQVGRSFYSDEAHGHRYWTFLSEELPSVVSRFFRFSERREDTYVAGLSMGGYGALKWALRQPERFAAAAGLSGALDVAGLLALPDRSEIAERVFDGDVGPEDDLFHLLERADPATLPSLYVGCGTEDPLVGGSRRFIAVAQARGIDVRTDLRPGGHEWALWDAVIRDVLAWLPSTT